MRSSADRAAPVAHFAISCLARHLDRDLDQIADDRIDVAPNIAHFGEFGRLDLDERRLREPGQPPRDLGLAHTGGADHQDVLGRDLGTQRLAPPGSPPAIAQGDGHRALGRGLADDVLVELFDDFARSHLRHGRYNSSMVRLRLV